MIKIKTLDSGVKVVTEQINHVQSVAIGIWVKAGAVNENKKNSGVSHFIEHMMFKGTENRSARKIAEDIDKIGGQINAFTGKEATCYYVKSLASNFDKSADVLVDMLTSSLFDKTEMDKERQVICEEIKMTIDSPDDLAHETITEQVFKGNPLGKSIIGTPSTLNNITRNVLTDYFKKEYARDNMVISVAGNVDENYVYEYFDKKFMNLEPTKEALNEPKEPYEKSFRVLVKDIEQSHICLATRGVKLYGEKYYPLAIVNNIMGGSMSSRLFQNIREEKGLAYSVYSMASSFADDGYFNIYAGVSHDKIKDAIEGIKEELAILEAKGVTKEELEASKEQLKASYIYGQESVASRMFAMGKQVMLMGKYLTPEDVISAIDGVTMDDTKEAEKLICNIDNYSAVAVTNKKIPLKKIMEQN